ncbi:hypothetical protein V8F06_014972, partial [Rhypophila decipiens]
MARYFTFTCLLLATLSSALVTHPDSELKTRDATMVACVEWCKDNFPHPGYVCIAALLMNRIESNRTSDSIRFDLDSIRYLIE